MPDQAEQRIRQHFLNSIAVKQQGKLLICGSGGNSKNVVRALNYTCASDIRTIASTGADGGKIAEAAEITARIPSTVAHIVCHLIERALFVEVK